MYSMISKGYEPIHNRVTHTRLWIIDEGDTFRDVGTSVFLLPCGDWEFKQVHIFSDEDILLVYVQYISSNVLTLRMVSLY